MTIKSLSPFWCSGRTPPEWTRQCQHRAIKGRKRGGRGRGWKRFNFGKREHQFLSFICIALIVVVGCCCCCCWAEDAPLCFPPRIVLNLFHLFIFGRGQGARASNPFIGRFFFLGKNENSRQTIVILSPSRQPPIFFLFHPPQLRRVSFSLCDRGLHLPLKLFSMLMF